eukprot:GHVP01047383.1.p1 GENE.GHVP01047383.1~~GHVP01047383.1.p1  ORF type:complete len:123 (+),score=6.83 GHVP01047383.1:165-533(+)
MTLDKIKEEKEESLKYYGPAVIVRKPNGAMRITHNFFGLKHSVPITSEDSILYGFIGPNNQTYKYVVLPMGTRNFQALFSEFMIKALDSIIFKYPKNLNGIDTRQVFPSFGDYTQLTISWRA